MTDVVEIAKERRARLATEIAKLDEFLRMAEKLVKYTPLESSEASDTDDEKAAGGIGAEAERKDLSVCKLTAKELMQKLRTSHNEPAHDRPEKVSSRANA